MCVCVCVCVWEREGPRKWKRECRDAIAKGLRWQKILGWNTRSNNGPRLASSNYTSLWINLLCTLIPLWPAAVYLLRKNYPLAEIFSFSFLVFWASICRATNTHTHTLRFQVIKSLWKGLITAQINDQKVICIIKKVVLMSPVSHNLKEEYQTEVDPYPQHNCEWN